MAGESFIWLFGAFGLGLVAGMKMNRETAAKCSDLEDKLAKLSAELDDERQRAKRLEEECDRLRNVEVVDLAETLDDISWYIERRKPYSTIPY